MPLQLFENCLAPSDAVRKSRSSWDSQAKRKSLKFPAVLWRRIFANILAEAIKASSYRFAVVCRSFKIFLFLPNTFSLAMLCSSRGKILDLALALHIFKKKYLQFDTTTNCLFDVFHPQRPPPATPMAFVLHTRANTSSFLPDRGWDRIMLSKSFENLLEERSRQQHWSDHCSFDPRDQRLASRRCLTDLRSRHSLVEVRRFLPKLINEVAHARAAWKKSQEMTRKHHGWSIQNWQRVVVWNEPICHQNHHAVQKT